MTHVCLYHVKDLDGQCSGAIWKTVFPDGELIGFDHGWKIPWDRLVGNDVTIVDLSLQPWSEMQKLLTVAASVTWIDHHKSAIESCGNTLIPGLRDTGFAACELTWKYYYPNKPMPHGVFLLGDYDCWRHSHPDTMVYQMGMRLYDMIPENPCIMPEWQQIFNNNCAHLELTLKEGHIILEYQKQQNARAAKAICFPVTFRDGLWLAANQGGINSQFFDTVKSDDYVGYLGFVRSRRHWTVSLYSENVDCGSVAKEYGGGGHKGAAGFQCQTLPFSDQIEFPNANIPSVS